jgi:hypothetical protein
MTDTQEESGDIDLLHEIGRRMAAADPLHEVLIRIIDMVTVAVRCDSCFLYVLEKMECPAPHPPLMTWCDPKPKN